MRPLSFLVGVFVGVLVGVAGAIAVILGPVPDD
jgi:hypothetical protein